MGGVTLAAAAQICQTFLFCCFYGGGSAAPSGERDPSRDVVRERRKVTSSNVIVAVPLPLSRERYSLTVPSNAAYDWVSFFFVPDGLSAPMLRASAVGYGAL